jgi:hypothetical protein
LGAEVLPMSSLSDVSLVMVQMETRATSSSAYKGHVACAKKLIDLIYVKNGIRTHALSDQYLKLAP